MMEFLFLDLDDTILNFHKAERIALSKTLRDFGVEPTEENLRKLENYLIDSPYVAATPESYSLLHEAMKELV